MSPDAADLSRAASTGHHQAHPPALAHHFDSLAQQTEATTLGMWVFLVTEVLFFGGLFVTYLVYRSSYPEAFAAGSHELDVTLGTINTVVLITSSLTMALAVHAAQLGQRKLLITFLILTMILGGVFLGIKSVEYYHKFVEHHVPGPGFQFEKEHLLHAQLFFSLYFVMTGLHAVHMIIGIGIMLVMLRWAWNGTITEEYSSPIEISGLYWHFVDIVWIFLFPLLYLIGRHAH
jgi:cytochrome c oxidase subunit III